MILPMMGFLFALGAISVTWFVGCLVVRRLRTFAAFALVPASAAILSFIVCWGSAVLLETFLGETVAGAAFFGGYALGGLLGALGGYLSAQRIRWRGGRGATKLEGRLAQAVAVTRTVDIPFTSSDIWLFLSIGAAESSPPADLANVLFAGDAINKAVFTRSELRRGLSKLTRAGLVSESEGFYSLTNAGRAMLQKAQARGRTWMLVREQLEKQLGATRGPADHPQFDHPEFPYPELTDDLIDAAYREYRRRFSDVLAKIDADTFGSRGK